MRWLVLSVVTLLAMSTIPTITAGGSDKHWNGYVLDRSSVKNHVLIDQNYDYYSLQSGSHDVVVVAFIFTTCPDVCPVITSNLIQAEKQLEDIDYQFISITVDPGSDSPAVLREYMEDFGASWPHLTAELDVLEEVWGDFGISVITEEIENHDHNHDHESTEQDNESNVIVVMPDGSVTSDEVELTGWDQLTAIAYDNDWSISSNYSNGSNTITGINGDDAPADNSWHWELHAWSEDSDSWESDASNIDSIDAGILALAPNSTDDSSITVPNSDNETMFYIVQSNGTTLSSELVEINAWHMSLGALDSFDTNLSQSGHSMDSINGVSNPPDGSWFWELHYWSEEYTTWISWPLEMDLLNDQDHIAWAPNSTSSEIIPEPGSEMVHKLGVVYPNGDSEMYDGTYFNTASETTAMAHTEHTFAENNIAFETINGEVTSINTVDGDYNLYIWHDMGDFSHWMSTSDSANESMLVSDTDHYAWVADGQDASSLASPESDGEESKETETSHSTQTFILNGDWKPKVVFVGYDWDVDLFVEDIKRAAGTTNDPGDSSSGIPGFTFVTATAGLGLAIIAASRDD